MGATTMGSDQVLTEFEWTWVVYDPRDPLGQIFALFTLSPVFIMVMYATLVVFQRDMDIIFMLIGQLANEVLNQILKRSIHQSRPHGARMSGSGMPSAHSQFITFFSTYVILYTWKRLNSHRRLEQTLTMVGAIVLATMVCVSRVRLGYHSLEQVLAGACVGCMAGLAWHMLGTAVAPRLFPVLVQSRLAQFFYVRDISHIPDLIVYQHELAVMELKRQHVLLLFLVGVLSKGVVKSVLGTNASLILILSVALFYWRAKQRSVTIYDDIARMQAETAEKLDALHGVGNGHVPASSYTQRKTQFKLDEKDASLITDRMHQYSSKLSGSRADRRKFLRKRKQRISEFIDQDEREIDLNAMPRTMNRSNTEAQQSERTTIESIIEEAIDETETG
ncbi:TPA: hypothetical protein N0F65_005210 [Lagenidium giganteum]|uniref:Dolichyldiphosphatase n=1 Tax=Lagenidium giganteum TaxID=4803 RepID=A0AAV2Z3N2_9STRA|nr:TPA: hypothetical protein N0F65_005210 [Lagenidium giganteum]